MDIDENVKKHWKWSDRNTMKRILTCSPLLRVADPCFNVEQLIQEYQSRKNDQEQMIVFPELCITGFSCGDLFLNDRLLESALEGLFRFAEVTADEETVALVSLPVRIDGKVYEIAALVGDGEVMAMFPRKKFSISQISRRRWFSEWDHNDEVLILDNGKEVYCCSGIVFNDTEYAVCFEAEKLDLFAEKADVVLAYASSPEYLGRSRFLREKAEKFTEKQGNLVVVLTPDMSESTGQGVCSGYAFAAENGHVLVDTALFSGEDLVVEKGMAGDYSSSDLDDCELAVSIQGHGLAQRLKKIWVNKIIIGISGGLDSTQALLAGIKALDILGLPHTNLIAVTMPCFGTTSRTKSNAQKLSELCGTDFREISIRESVVQHLKDIGHDGVTADVAFENAQARERTQVLMDIANMENAIVLGTGDMSEAALGWCTYNGDHMSMYNVNCNMTKTFLRQVVRYEAEHSDNEEIAKVLLDVIDTPVSPELKPSEQDNISQKTEDILGPYEVLDRYLELLVREKKGPKDILVCAIDEFSGKYSEEELKKWLNQFIKRFFNNQFKRNCVPDGPRVIDYDLSPANGWIMTSDTSNGSFLNIV